MAKKIHFIFLKTTSFASKVWGTPASKQMVKKHVLKWLVMAWNAFSTQFVFQFQSFSTNSWENVGFTTWPWLQIVPTFWRLPCDLITLCIFRRVYCNHPVSGPYECTIKSILHTCTSTTTYFYSVCIVMWALSMLHVQCEDVSQIIKNALIFLQNNCI